MQLLCSAYLIPRSATTFRHPPGDDAVGVGNFAGFAVEAVGGVEFERWNGLCGEFVHRCGAKVLAGVGELRMAFFEAYPGNIFRFDVQVAGLVLFVHKS